MINFELKIEKIFNELLCTSENEIAECSYFPINRLIYIYNRIGIIIKDYYRPPKKIHNYYNYALLNNSEVFQKLNDNIPYVIVKGVVNAQFYPKKDYRKSSDIDVLIPPQYCSQVENIMSDLGYCQAHLKNNTITPYNRKEKLFYITQTHQMAPFIKRNISIKNEDIIYIDYNFGFESKNYEDINMESFISDRVFFSYNNLDLYILPIEKNLLFTILHEYKDITNKYLLVNNNGYKLKNFIDIYLIFLENKKTLNFSLFKDIIESINVSKKVFYIIYILSCMFGDKELWCLSYYTLNPESRDMLFDKIDSEKSILHNIPLKQRFNHKIVNDYLENNIKESQRSNYIINKEYL